MFTFGILSSHIPYIAMVVFYAWFLISGLNKSTNGEIQTAENSTTIQIHVNNSGEIVFAGNTCFYAAFIEDFAPEDLNESKIKQKWKWCIEEHLIPKNFVVNTLFGRPPPHLA